LLRKKIDVKKGKNNGDSRSTNVANMRDGKRKGGGGGGALNEERKGGVKIGW